MLALTRKKNESVMIGDDIEVFVVECSDGKVKLGFTAPQHVQIWRKEIWHERRQQAGKEQPK